MNSLGVQHAESNILTLITRLFALLEPRMRLEFMALLVPMLIIAVLEMASIVKVVFLGEGSTCRFAESEMNGPLANVAIKERERAARVALSCVGVA